MEKIVSETKKLKNGYKVFFDDEPLSIQLELDIYLKFHIKPGLSMDDKTYQQMVKENNELHYKRLGIERLKKMQTEKELFDYLVDKGCSRSLAKQLIQEYKDRRYVNDDEYTKIYVDIKKHQYGPMMLKVNLLKKGVNQVIIEKWLNKINEEEILSHLVTKKMSSFRNKTKRQIMTATKTYFLSKEFSRDFIDSLIDSHMKDLTNTKTKALSKRVIINRY